MKTSKYILIAFFSFIFGFILILFISSKLHKDEKPSVKVLEEKLDDFSVIVAEEGAKIGITSDSLFYMKITLYEDSIIQFPDYRIINDTLFVSPTSHRYLYPNIHCKKLTAIIGKPGSNIQFSDYYADSLLINLTNGEIRGNNKGQTIEELKICATQNSEIYFYQSHINSMQLSLNQSKARINNSKIKQLNAEIANTSDLSSSHIEKINLNTDSTSTYNVYKR